MHLIVSREKEESQRALYDLLRGYRYPVTHFYSETFTPNGFLQEVETLPFLSQEKGVVIHELDQVSETGQKTLLKYLEKPSPWISIFLTALDLPATHKIAKLIEKKGKVLRFKDEKPWEKEKRLTNWLIAEAEQEGCSLSREASFTLVRGVESEMLLQELSKLICYVGENRRINLEDVKTLSLLNSHETIWQLADAIMGKEVLRALKIGKELLEEGVAIFSLLAHLRSQFSNGIDLLKAAEQGQAAQQFPYLKGNLLEKKLQMLKKQGIERLKQAVILIFDSEIQVKNSSIDSSLLLELLTIKLCHDTLPIT